MKKKELKDLRKKTSAELSKLAFEKSKAKFQKNSKNLRRDIAQVLTIAREIEIIEKMKKTEE